ncbi:MAG TPA: hypothetical protein HPQ03_10625, partial [Deltaproteobacteria bacterium]|nr:hypothetical protein [Deltaproteobacteria bacterium]
MFASRQTHGVIGVITFLFFIFSSALSFATSASITASGNEGAISVNANASFTSYEYCVGEDPPECWTVDWGFLTVSLYRESDGYTMGLGSVSGEGSVSFSTILDGGSISQGTYLLRAVATDSESVTSTSNASITIDNTPTVTVSSPGLVEGAFTIDGTTQFKERVDGYEGMVYVSALGTFGAYKNFEGTDITWNWNDFPNAEPLDAGSYTNGDYTVIARAKAYNGAWSEDAIGTLTIDNTPTVT